MASGQELDGLLRWRCIGPHRGGRVVTVAGSYHDENAFYFGAVAGGIWKTVDAGQYWECVSDGFLTTSSIGALAVAPSDSNVIYAGTGETTIRIDVSHGDGMYKSIDAGKTWAHIGLRETKHIGKIRVHPNDPDTVWVAAFGHAFGANKDRGVYKSTDGGKTWRQTLFVSDKAGAVDLTIDEQNPRIMYAAIWEAYRSFWQISSGGADSGLWQSVDGGETWTNISDRQGLPKGIKGKIAVAASPAQSGRVWALIENQPDGGLYRSDDIGQTWTKVCDNQNLLSRAWYYTHLTADPQDAESVYCNNLAFWKSSDGGSSFIEIDTPHGDNHDLWIDPKNNKRMIQGNDGGANVSVNGGYTFSTIYNQPTAQFYHICTDNRDPYIVYGTQQDNSSIATPSRTNKAAITMNDVFVAGTGESGYIAVDPRDNDIVYVGAIGSSPGGGNSLQRYDRKTDQIRLITTWPEYESGVGASAHKYRFNWTYPIVFSPHDPKTIYIGGNMVFKTTNEGQSWQAISPDLSKADPKTLEPTGGPVNKDAIGAEIYATVYAFAESAHEPGVLWAGSDDGVIHISKDGGAKWTKIAPKDLPEWTMISCIELSPFDKGTAYVAGTRYKLDDYAPYLWVTRDYGKSWTRINSGIRGDDFTRVIRCDPTTPGLLYAGTETGVYVSYDDGANWQPFQLNLPVCPIHDLLVKGTDLIAGTHGRSIWILDDLSPVRDIAAGKAPKKGNHLFAPRPVTRILPGIDWSGVNGNSTNYLGGMGSGYRIEQTPDGEVRRRWLDAGENAPRGAIVTYRLDKAPDEPITLTFKNAKGEVLRTFTSRTKEDPAIAKELRAPAAAGWNRFVWDLRRAPAAKLQGGGEGTEEPVIGPMVAPGEFTVTLSAGGKELSQSFQVVKPVNVKASQADLDKQEELLLKLHNQTDRTVKAINRMRDVRAQLDGWATRAKEQKGGEEVAEAAKALSAKVLEIEQTLMMPGLRPGWADRINAGVRLLDKLAAMPPVIQMGDYKPTDQAREAFADLAGRIEAQIKRFDDLAATELKAFNKQVASARLGAVLV